MVKIFKQQTNFEEGIIALKCFANIKLQHDQPSIAYRSGGALGSVQVQMYYLFFAIN